MQNKVIEMTSFRVFRETDLTKIGQKELTHLYMPLIGPNAINLYMTLYSFLDDLMETDVIAHLKLFKLLKIKKEDEFIKERCKLEAVGLLRVYVAENDFIYEIKSPLTPSQFFKNEVLSTFLFQNVSSTEFNELAMEFLIHSFDLNKYTDMTKSFDDVFKASSSEVSYASELSSLIKVNDADVVVKNEHFDYQYFIILLSALDIIDKDILNSKSLYELVNRYSFLYLLSTEQIKDAIIASATPNKELDVELFKKACKDLYTKKNKTVKFIPKSNPNEQNRLINYLEVTSPTEIVKTKFGVGLVASEIEMFDSLLKTTGISLGILNVLIIYVLQDKNGEVPSYNYFDKIIKTWQRMGISSTLEAIDHINGRDKAPKAQAKKNSKPVPSWYEKYNEEFEKTNFSKPVEAEEEAMKELNELFKFKETN